MSIVGANSSEGLEKAVNRAAGILSSGGLVAYPTESFYGLAADVADETAIRRLFSVKRRPANRPLLLLIPVRESLVHCVHTVPTIAKGLMEAFWPGGLTLVLEASQHISPLLTAGTGKIGIRLSSHPVATALAKAVGGPITGTSANISGQPPCSNAPEVFRSLGQLVDMILDGGETEGGRGSTILDVTTTPPTILREGMIERDKLEEFISPSSSKQQVP